MLGVVANMRGSHNNIQCHLFIMCCCCLHVLQSDVATQKGSYISKVYAVKFPSVYTLYIQYMYGTVLTCTMYIAVHIHVHVHVLYNCV